eukprot:TRINITY_DN42_c0_g1_i10.p1 TRINITY_DN42_c0_g1~~TRINITY_DN42_c0_g1_i10.p1  ORF type:complete len:834 (+),score=340.43 TRINITY_DN42_c0_g1_i10:50-2551(+)
MTDKAKKADREKTWEKVQMKAFTSWVNSYLDKRGKKIVNLETDMSDGILLCEFLEIVCDKKLKTQQRQGNNELMRVHRIQNVGYALKFIQEELSVRLVGVGAEDIVDGSTKLLLGLLWSLFRRLRIQTINTEDKSSEEGLLLWVKKITEGYYGVNIDKFNNSFSDGLALMAMINAYDPSLVDYDALNPNDREGNLNKAFEIAESKMGIPKLLEAADLMDGNPDERSVILYISLFFHAFVSNEDNKKRNEEREKEKKEREKKLTDLQSQLGDYADKISAIEKVKTDLLSTTQGLQTQLDAKEKSIKELEDKNQDLLLELDEIKKKIASEKERAGAKANFLEEKVNLLNKVLEENEDAKNDAEEKSNQLKKELEFQKQINQEMVTKQEQILGEVSSTKSKLEDEVKKRSKMKAEVEDIKKKVGKEVERRREKSRAIAELQQEIQALKRRAIVEGKARRGLDVLKKNLEEHLEEMYQWRDLHQADLEGEKNDFDLEKVLTQISSKPFEDQLEILNDKLQVHNSNLQRIIKLKDSHQELKDTVIKDGWLYMKASKKQKEWIKRWFVLSTSTLNYYKDEKTPQHLCSCPLVDCQLVALKAEKVEDPNFPVKKFFITKISVLDFTIYIGFASLKEKSSWIIPLKNRVQHLTYLRALEKSQSRPDTRILALFNSREIKSCNLHDNPIPVEGVEAITGVLSLQEGLENLNLVHSDLGDAEVKPLTDSLSKWKLKSLNLNHNKITSEGASAIIKSLASAPNEFLTDLYLEDNQLDDAALQALAESLPNLPKLKTVYLQKNKIGDKGVKALVEALSKTPILSPLSTSLTTTSPMLVLWILLHF